MVHKKVSKEITKNVNLNESKLQTIQDNLKNGTTIKQSETMKKEQVSVKKVQKNVQLEQKKSEFKTYFHCKICKTDIFQNNEALSHLGK